MSAMTTWTVLFLVLGVVLTVSSQASRKRRDLESDLNRLGEDTVRFAKNFGVEVNHQLNPDQSNFNRFGEDATRLAKNFEDQVNHQFNSANYLMATVSLGFTVLVSLLASTLYIWQH